MDRFALTLALGLAGCSTTATHTPADAGEASDAGAALPDAYVPDDAGAATDAGPEAPTCFTEEVVLATSTSRISPGGIVAYEGGWLAHYRSTSEPGREVVWVDAAGRVARRVEGDLATGAMYVVDGSIVTISPQGAQRHDLLEGSVRSYEAHDVGWGSSLGAGRAPDGTLRMISYDAHVHVEDLRIHVTDITLDDSQPTGLALRDGALPLALTESLGASFDSARYVVEGDDRLRVLGAGRAVLLALGLDALGSDEPLTYEVLEDVALEPSDASPVGVTPDGARVILGRYADGVPSTSVAPIPGHAGAETVSLGAGWPSLLDATLARVDGGAVRIHDRASLAMRMEVTASGTVVGLAEQGEAVAVLAHRMLPDGTVTLAVRCARSAD